MPYEWWLNPVRPTDEQTGHAQSDLSRSSLNLLEIFRQALKDADNCPGHVAVIPWRLVLTQLAQRKTEEGISPHLGTWPLDRVQRLDVLPSQPISESHGSAAEHVVRVGFPKGERVVRGPDGSNVFVDKDGKQITVVAQIEGGKMPGTVQFRLSNGAIYTSGCWNDTLSYPDGTSMSVGRLGVDWNARLQKRAAPIFDWNEINTKMQYASGPGSRDVYGIRLGGSLNKLGLNL